MGNAGNIGCTPTLARAAGCNPTLAPSLSNAPTLGCTPSLAGGKNEECFDPCTPALSAGRALDPLTDQECADIALVQATVRGEATDVVRALSLGAQPNTLAELTLRMGEPSKKGRRGSAVHVTPLMRACDLGHEDVALLLLRAKASALQCDSHGWTALCHALGAGEISIAKLVLQHSSSKITKQKDICRKLSAEILLKCETEASQESVAVVQKELGPGGFFGSEVLDKPDGFFESGTEVAAAEAGSSFAGPSPTSAPAKEISGADAMNIHPLVEKQDIDLLGGFNEYEYPQTTCEVVIS